MLCKLYAQQSFCLMLGITTRAEMFKQINLTFTTLGVNFKNGVCSGRV